jgi:hypothetical protein
LRVADPRERIRDLRGYDSAARSASTTRS